MEGRYHPLGKPLLNITDNTVRKILRYNRNSQKLNDCVKELCNCYTGSSLRRGESDVQFDDPIYQACYVFLYFPVLCYGVFHGLLQMIYQRDFGIYLERASLDGCLRVCALGGGPGTDLFGVRMFLNQIGYGNVIIKGTVLDKHRNWSYAFNCLSSQIYQQSSLSAKYFHLEIGSQTVLQDHLKYVLYNADIITCSKFVSAVRMLPNSKETLLEVLGYIKPNTFIFYMDNSQGGNSEFFGDVAWRANCIPVACFGRGGENDPFQLPKTENSRFLELLSSREWFNFKSQRNLRVTYMLWRKIG